MYQSMPMQYGTMNNPQALQLSLKLIKEAVSDEKTDEAFYNYLISIAPTKEQKDIIASIRDDERKHNKMFRKIYKNFTGVDLPPGKERPFEKPKTYVQGIKKALFGELKAVEKYRVIRQGLPYRNYRDMLFEIITDELKHSAKYNYLYTLNRTKKLTRSLQDDYSESNILAYIMPAVSRILNEVDGEDLERAVKDFNISNVLEKMKGVLSEATQKVEEWENSDETKIFKKNKE